MYDHIQKNKEQQQQRIADSYNSLEKSEAVVETLPENVIGYTTTGKEILKSHGASDYEGFTPEDHEGGAYFHLKEAGQSSKGTRRHNWHLEKAESHLNQIGMPSPEEWLEKSEAYKGKLDELQKAKTDELKKGEGENELGGGGENPVELRKSELEEEIGRLNTTINSRINVDGSANYITKGMQSDLGKKKRELAHIKQFNELPSAE